MMAPMRFAVRRRGQSLRHFSFRAHRFSAGFDVGGSMGFVGMHAGRTRSRVAPNFVASPPVWALKNSMYKTAADPCMGSKPRSGTLRRAVVAVVSVFRWFQVRCARSIHDQSLRGGAAARRFDSTPSVLSSALQFALRGGGSALLRLAGLVLMPFHEYLCVLAVMTQPFRRLPLAGTRGNRGPWGGGQVLSAIQTGGSGFFFF